MTQTALLTTNATYRGLQMSPVMVRPTKIRLKTETRRTRGLTQINSCPDAWEFMYFAGIDALGRLLVKFKNTEEDDQPTLVVPCAYGRPGDTLWVRENWTYMPDGKGGKRVAFQADFTDEELEKLRSTVRWRPSIHLERVLSRIDLNIITIGIERLHDITEEAAMNEGFDPILVEETGAYSYVAAFQQLWKKLNGNGSWELNPWVWVINFNLIKINT